MVNVCKCYPMGMFHSSLSEFRSCQPLFIEICERLTRENIASRLGPARSSVTSDLPLVDHPKPFNFGGSQPGGYFLHGGCSGCSTFYTLSTGFPSPTEWFINGSYVDVAG